MPGNCIAPVGILMDILKVVLERVLQFLIGQFLHCPLIRQVFTIFGDDRFRPVIRKIHIAEATVSDMIVVRDLMLVPDKYLIQRLELFLHPQAAVSLPLIACRLEELIQFLEPFQEESARHPIHLEAVAVIGAADAKIAILVNEIANSCDPLPPICFVQSGVISETLTYEIVRICYMRASLRMVPASVGIRLSSVEARFFTCPKKLVLSICEAGNEIHMPFFKSE